MSKIFKGQTQIGGANVVKFINAWALLEYCMGERARAASQKSTCILGLQERCSRAFPPKKTLVFNCEIQSLGLHRKLNSYCSLHGRKHFQSEGPTFSERSVLCWRILNQRYSFLSAIGSFVPIISRNDIFHL